MKSRRFVSFSITQLKEKNKKREKKLCSNLLFCFVAQSEREKRDILFYFGSESKAVKMDKGNPATVFGRVWKLCCFPFRCEVEHR